MSMGCGQTPTKNLIVKWGNGEGWGRGKGGGEGSNQLRHEQSIGRVAPSTLRCSGNTGHTGLQIIAITRHYFRQPSVAMRVPADPTAPSVVGSAALKQKKALTPVDRQRKQSLSLPPPPLTNTHTHMLAYTHTHTHTHTGTFTRSHKETTTVGRYVEGSYAQGVASCQDNRVFEDHIRK